MSWIGKILAVMVMLLAVFGMWLTASAFAVRTNWKVQADTYKKAFDEAKAARESEYRTNQSERDALARQVKAELTKVQGLIAQLEKAGTENTENAKSIAQLKVRYDTLNVQAAELQANLAAAQSGADKLQDRVNRLEEDKIKLTVTTEQAVKDKQAAETLARQAQADKLIAERKAEELASALADEKVNRGGSLAGGTNLFTPRPTPVPEGVRGTVERYDSGYVVINLGIDHGVTKGATLDVYRTGTDAKYLGTVVIDTAYPQAAVGTFRPSDPRRSIRSLRPDELPKTGDRVGRVGSVGSTP